MLRGTSSLGMMKCNVSTKKCNILDYLNRNGLAENTIFAYTSDQLFLYRRT